MQNNESSTTYSVTNSACWTPQTLFYIVDLFLEWNFILCTCINRAIWVLPLRCRPLIYSLQTVTRNEFGNSPEIEMCSMKHFDSYVNLLLLLMLDQLNVLYIERVSLLYTCEVSFMYFLSYHRRVGILSFFFVTWDTSSFDRLLILILMGAWCVLTAKEATTNKINKYVWSFTKHDTICSIRE